MKKLLIHICCAPCFTYPYAVLKDRFELYALWFNPYIHPYTEYQKRLDEVQKYCDDNNVKLIIQDLYELKEFTRKVSFREHQRCFECYYQRLQHAAKLAKKSNFDFFTSTLLYSKQQKHKLIIQIANDLSKEFGVSFYYEDFRSGWKKGIELSKRYGMFRQQYCGCIYSEEERYRNAGKVYDQEKE